MNHLEAIHRRCREIYYYFLAPSIQ